MKEGAQLTMLMLKTVTVHSVHKEPDDEQW